LGDPNYDEEHPDFEGDSQNYEGEGFEDEPQS
jgi:hypothetical protein